MSPAILKRSLLSDRGLLAVRGGDAADFLQNLITNDINLLAQDSPVRRTAIYAALLSPQGKYLFDFFVVADATDGYLLDCEAARQPELMQRFAMYKLRADVSLSDRSGEFSVSAFWGAEPGEVEGILYEDPRHRDAGWRLISAIGSGDDHGEDYEKHRLALGLSNGSVDIQVDRNFFLEANGDLQAGVAFDKGCFVGQETTARMKHRNLVRKRLLPLIFEATAPAVDSVVQVAGKAVGEVRSRHGNLALAQLRLEGLKPGTGISADGVMGQVGNLDGWPSET